MGFIAVIILYKPAPATPFSHLEHPQPTKEVGGKIEIISFFMYHCPYCHQIEEELNSWVLQNNDKVHFRRIPLSFGKDEPGTRLFYSLEENFVEDQFHESIMKRIHIDRDKFTQDESSILNWANQQPSLSSTFAKAWQSPEVIQRTNDSASIATRYSVSAAPTIIVDGQFVTSPDHLARSSLGNDKGSLSTVLTSMLEEALLSKTGKRTRQ
jgi:thiol:disulfide interchange protein DsbA